MNARNTASAALFLVILASPLFHTQACGPDFEPDTFVRTNFPDELAAFTQGHLGIVQRGYDSDEYAIAFRYLNGGKLSAEERANVAPPGNTPDYTDYLAYQEKQKGAAEKQPSHLWALKRAEYTTDSAPATQASTSPGPSSAADGNIILNPNYLNCPDPAFQTAALTLDKRAAAWGKQSPYLADWLRAQDAVFSNCAGKTATFPTAPPSNSPALLQADRAYQLASASFYSGQFDKAAQQFQAIAADKQSPWAPWGSYLAGRALVRKAFSLTKQTDQYSSDLATWDGPTMAQAQHLLESLLADKNPQPSRSVIQHELNFIRIRTEPEKRIQEISAAIAGPQSSPDFTQDLADLNFYLIKYPDKKSPTAPFSPTLLTWIAAWRGFTPPNTSLDLWHSTHSLPWLVTALVNASPTDASTPELLAAAEKIENSGPANPAYQTVLYHRIRLLIGRGPAAVDQARTLLDRQLAIMPPDKAHSDRNAFLRERFSIARDFSDLLHYAPRVDQEATSGSASASLDQCMQQHGQQTNLADCPANRKPLEFDNDAVLVLNQKTPLPRLLEAAASPQLPKNLQNELALAAWTRAILLDDLASAQKLVPLLPPSLKITAQNATGFPAILLILRNPGLRPTVEAGVSRLDTPAVLDNYRDNWWCSAKPLDTNSTGPQPTPDAPSENQDQPLPTPSVFTSDEQKLAAAQHAALIHQPGAPVTLGRRVLDYAKDHPTDPAVPEALALTVRATRYSCTYADKSPAAREQTAISKAAFQFLHTHYPNSPWTAKTPYYY